MSFLINRLNTATNTKIISILFTLIIYIILLSLLYLTELHESTSFEKDGIYLEFENKKVIENLIEENNKTIKSKNPNNIDLLDKSTNISIKEKVQVYSDSLQKKEIPTKFSEKTDSLNHIDSFVLDNPSLISLQIALKDHINKNGFKKSQREELISKIETSMQDYYKMKYPTPYL